MTIEVSHEGILRSAILRITPFTCTDLVKQLPTVAVSFYKKKENVQDMTIT
jgi:hypothetical protein